MVHGIWTSVAPVWEARNWSGLMELTPESPAWAARVMITIWLEYSTLITANPMPLTWTSFPRPKAGTGVIVGKRTVDVSEGSGKGVFVISAVAVAGRVGGNAVADGAGLVARPVQAEVKSKTSGMK